MDAKVLIALVALAGVAGPAAAADSPPAPVSAQSPAPRPAYQCPTAVYLNCMPPISAERRESCAKDYLAWVQVHCPKTQIVY